MHREIPDTICQYRVTGYIDGGGAGRVYSAWDELLKRTVALKLLHPQRVDSSHSKRLLQEAAALGRLSHPNIVSIYEVLSFESQPVLAMEFVEGQNLAQWLEGQHVAPQSAAQLMLKLAGALHYAHTKGVIHRDLKPANIMLEKPLAQRANSKDLSSFVPKITDFGLAKLAGGTTLTDTGTAFGTAAYAAPEQATGSHASGPAVDIYALGVILYELLTGRVPFVADNAIQTLALVQHAQPVSPRVYNARVPKDLETICLKCLAKVPTDRYAAASAFGDDLGAYLEGRPVAARPINSAIKSWRWIGRNRILSATILTVVLSLWCIAIGGRFLAAREKELRLKADESLARTEKSERQKVKQLEITIREAHALWDLLIEQHPKNQQNVEIFESFFDAFIKSLPSASQWTKLELEIIEFYTYQADPGSARYRKLINEQVVAATRLGKESPQEFFYQRIAARSLVLKAIHLSSSPAETRQLIEQAYEHSKKALALVRNSESYSLCIAMGGNLSSIYINEERYEDAYAINLETLPCVEAMAVEFPSLQGQMDIADRLSRLALAGCKLNPRKPCGALLDRAIKILEPLVDNAEVGPKARSLLETARSQRKTAAEENCL